MERTQDFLFGFCSGVPLCNELFFGFSLLMEEDSQTVLTLETTKRTPTTFVLAKTQQNQSLFWHPRVDIYQHIQYLSVTTTK
jgi:hypothetical protein